MHVFSYLKLKMAFVRRASFRRLSFEVVDILRSPRKRHRLNSDLVLQTLEIKTDLSVNGFQKTLKRKSGLQNT